MRKIVKAVGKIQYLEIVAEQVVKLTASTGKLVYEGTNEKSTYDACDSSNWDRGTGLTKSNAANENDTLQACAGRD